ncbi:MAG: class I SAM-dependent DNA methyltransferase [Eubacteriales bacterium]|nr:class I SAM-dependent DNA methyltransferase [Eubacteriales bacterium]
MLTGAVRNKVDNIWEQIWSGGIVNPITVIEQLTYLMFIHDLDEKELKNESFEAVSGQKMPRVFPRDEAGQQMRWSRFRHLDAREMYDIIALKVFPFIKSLNGGGDSSAFTRYMKDAMFLFPEGNKNLLQKVVTGLDELYEHDLQNRDLLGDLYEYMLGKLSVSGQNGQFRTPKHIRDMMVGLVRPGPRDLICDPACGTAGFLISSAEYIREHHANTMTAEDWARFSGPAFTGFDSDSTMLRISAMNLMLHSITHPQIEYKDSVSRQNDISGRYDVILANPPFTGSVDKEAISDSLKAVTNTKKTELLFVALFLRMLKKGGRCACIVPDGVLFGSSRAHKALRQELVERHHMRAVISMPSGVFKPYAGVSTAVLVFTKTGAGGTDKVWFYDMKADGFSLDDKRTEQPDSDIPDILKRFHALDGEEGRARTEQSFLVDKAEIVEKGYDLSINRYKEAVYEKVEYDPPFVIMERIEAINRQVESKLSDLRRLVNEQL